MTDRRTFLKMNLALPLALTMGPYAFASAKFDGQKPDFLFVESSDDVSLQAAGPNTKVIRFQADPIELWTDHCLPAIENGRPVFAGITTGYTAFSLSEIARDFGYKLEESTALDSIELNSRDEVTWVLQPNGINFRNNL